MLRAPAISNPGVVLGLFGPSTSFELFNVKGQSCELEIPHGVDREAAYHCCTENLTTGQERVNYLDYSGEREPITAVPLCAAMAILMLIFNIKSALAGSQSSSQLYISSPPRSRLPNASCAGEIIGHHRFSSSFALLLFDPLANSSHGFAKDEVNIHLQTKYSVLDSMPILWWRTATTRFAYQGVLHRKRPCIVICQLHPRTSRCRLSLHPKLTPLTSSNISIMFQLL